MSYGPHVELGKPLSPRERETLATLAAGKTKRQAAEALGISWRTVDDHMKTAYVKLGAHNLVQALRAANLIAAEAA